MFSSGEADLDNWLKNRALKNEGSGASRTYVVCTTERKIVGYYCLATGALAVAQAPGKVRRNMPDPIPVMIIGRLAVHKEWHGQGLGRSLLANALQRILQAAEIAGIRAVLVHAISGKAKAFYEKCGFFPSPVDPMILMVTLAEVKAILSP
ncbi:MAG: GNAT family N-acetyltransferase [Nitrospirae bacterium]|nr:GNAT family N-acetyltransferase [Nitrospirota bacterium]MBI3351854.1 GNAT family N-acetyltransferase [Nitrospirota bacterium]